ncbi:hypothetical protein chiPu_0026071, partial [Chiloscyllium punctatum]|nr:hypothetical protein [Chiloscyllium punctatum]
MVRFALNEAVTKKGRGSKGKVPGRAAKGDGGDAETDGVFEDTPDRLETEDGNRSDLKISSWNVDGLRAWVKKDGVQ